MEGALIYGEAAGGSSWFDAATVGGVDGPHLARIQVAKRIARMHARTYGEEWPLEVADHQDGEVAFLLAFEEGYLWSAIASRLSYESPEQAAAHAREYANRAGRQHDFDSLSEIGIGLQAYRLREQGCSWGDIGKQLGVSRLELHRKAGRVAGLRGLEWPLRLHNRKRKQERLQRGEEAYNLRQDRYLSWHEIAEKCGGTHHTIKRAAAEYAATSGATWPILREDLTFEHRCARGKEIYEIRERERLEWSVIAERVGGSPSNATRLAHLYARTEGKPWPVWTAHTLGEALYNRKAETGWSWDEVGVEFAIGGGHAANMARQYAREAGKPWPLGKKGCLTGKFAYELRAKDRRPWATIGESLGVKPLTAMLAASQYAKEHNLPWPLSNENEEYGKRGYHLRADGGKSWTEVSMELGASDSHIRKEAARYAKENDLPWPLKPIARPRGNIAGAYALRTEGLAWAEIAKQIGCACSTAQEWAKLHAEEQGLEWPVPQKDTGELAYKLRIETQEVWSDIAKRLEKEARYVHRAAKKYAETNELEWPPPTTRKRKFRDTGRLAYEMRQDKKLQWSEIAEQLGISYSFAFDRARHHARCNNLPWPLSLPDGTCRKAYELRARGTPWAEVAKRFNLSLTTAQTRARRHAEDNGLQWPIAVHVPRGTHSERAARAYQMGYIEQMPWSEVAETLGYSGRESARNSAKAFAKHSGKPFKVKRRHTPRRDPKRQEAAYRTRMENPQMSWSQISKHLEFKSNRGAQTAALQHAMKNDLPWPLP